MGELYKKIWVINYIDMLAKAEPRHLIRYKNKFFFWHINLSQITSATNQVPILLHGSRSFIFLFFEALTNEVL